MNLRGVLMMMTLLALSIPGETWAAAEPSSKKVTGGEATTLEPLSDPQEVFFTVLKYDVEGNTILPQETIDNVLKEFTGFAQQFGDIEKARKALEKTYHEEGYPTVIVVLPQQEIDQGLVKLTVVESQIGTVSMKGNRFFSEELLMEKLPSLKPGWVIHQPTLLKELAKVNFHPDRKVTPILQPGEETGKVNLELKVNDRLPLHGKIKIDNKGAQATPENRLTAELQYTNLLDLEHILTLQTVQTPEDWGAVQVYGFTYVAPLGKNNHLLAVFGSISESSSTLAGSGLPVGSQGFVNIAGNSKSAGIRYTFPILESDTFGTHQLSLGADFTRLEKSTAKFPSGLGGGDFLISAPVQYTPLSLSYTGIIPHHSGITSLSGTLRGYVAGMIPGGDKVDFAGDPNDFDNKPGNRVGSTGTFGVVKGTFQRSQQLPENYTANARIMGQWANEPLLAAEEIFAGGMDTVRGYHQNETLGDNGVLTRLEVLSPFYSIPFDRTFAPKLRADVQWTVFYDTGFVWVLRVQPNQLQRFNLEGAGLGFRLKLNDIVNLQVDHAWAIRDAGRTFAGDRFIHFMVDMAI